ncbi:MAG: ribose-5-phosphate isomerase [Candidatus Magasanikbacteria bacterium CG11_big_fil_rev_8_21_14_0_20_39_34]|uniref:Ribose-5-phosphate isomerase n=1 Tax=Candidatus Magasanikbacteria bacterium CG11_big_fil_rev_8_21_14_0_20_39_34 TaxID=1974653 RepID=A0A2H0N4D2_9BACT|nr:MAG: ribose-5-phosphate isomerase [Candidatus Magasanikbacteria bacterium CG11_big_fil_rev_8_21_14_0_20_39_34]
MLMYSGPLFIASDHGGYHLKKRLVRYIENELKQKIEDLGPHEYAPEDDYPDYTHPLTQQVLHTNGRGIVICKNGIGVSIACNKVPGIRCGIGYNLMAAETMMQDDNTNILALASKALSEDHAMAIVKCWLETSFSNADRHVRRLVKVSELEK